MMARQPRQQPARSPRVIDPDKIPETLCDGRFNIHVHGNLCTLTFTCARPDANDLFNGTINTSDVVRARITMTLDNIVALRDLLTRCIQTPDVPAEPAGAGGPTHH